MKDKIYKYLQSKATGASSDELLEEFFHTLGVHPTQMEKIIYKLLENDNRFVRDENGYWHAKKAEVKKDRLHETNFCVVDFATVRLSRKFEIPVLLGIAEIQNLKVIEQSFCKINYGQVLGVEINLKLSFGDEVQANFADVADDLFQKSKEKIFISRSPQKHRDWLGILFRHYCGIDYDFQFLSLNDLSLQLSKTSAIKALQTSSAAIDGSESGLLEFSCKFEAEIQLFIDLIQLALGKSIETLSELINFITEKETWTDFSKYDFNRDFLRSLPEKPGVYFFIDQHEKIFYVGKSKNLKSRISSYFVDRTNVDSKTKKILERIKKIDYQVVGSELEALLLENRYIRKFEPEINVQINTHRKIPANLKKRKIILLLPDAEDSRVRIFLVDGLRRGKSFSIDRNDEKLVEKCIESIENFYSEEDVDDSDYDDQQIEIIWRWYELNSESVNFVDVENYSSLLACAKATINFIKDESLFREQIIFQES